MMTATASRVIPAKASPTSERDSGSRTHMMNPIRNSNAASAAIKTAIW